MADSSSINGTPLRKRRPWTKQEIVYLRTHVDTESIESIATTLRRLAADVSKYTISVGLRKAGQGHRHYFIPDDLFAYLTPEWSYCLGFIMADGCVTQGRFLKISITDRDILVKIVNAIGVGHPIKEVAPRNGGWNKAIGRAIQTRKMQYSLEVGSKELVSRLGRYGIVARKSLICRLPELTDEHFWHFLRGYVDGDGSIGKYGRKFCLQITSGSAGLLDDLNSRIAALTETPPRTIHHRQGRTLCLAYQDRLASRICELMYVDAGELYLQRKRDKYEEHRDRPNPRPDHPITFNGETLPINAWAARVGFPANAIYQRIYAGWSVHDALTRPVRNDRIITFNGETHNLKDWARQIGINYGTLTSRLNEGWSVAKAFTQPLRQWPSTIKCKDD